MKTVALKKQPKEVRQMEPICKKSIGTEDEYHLLLRRYHICRTAYVPPEFRNMAIVNVSSKTEIEGSSIMFRYEDPIRRGNKIYGIVLPMAHEIDCITRRNNKQSIQRLQFLPFLPLDKNEHFSYGL